MMTDESVVEWAIGWLRDNPPNDPTFQQRFLDGLRLELAARSARTLALERAQTDELVAALDDVSLDEGFWSPGWQRVRKAREVIEEARNGSA